jgi:hypothetical protein
MRNLSDTYVFALLTKTIPVMEIIQNQITPDVIVEKTLLRDALNTISRKFVYSVKNKVLQNVLDDKIVFVYDDKNGLNLPNYFPFWGNTKDGKVVIYINISRYATRTIDGHINIQPRTLFSLILGATIALINIESPTKFSYNTNILKLSAKIYSKMLFKTLDKVYGVGQDAMRADYILFLCGKFFIKNIVGLTDEEKINNIAYSCIKNTSTLNGMVMNEASHNIDYENLDKFIMSMSVVPGLKSIQTRVVLQNYIKSFSEPILLAIENFNYFLYNLFAAQIGAFVNNEAYIQNIAGRDLETLFVEVSKIV